ncbi:MAG: hypothetical protein ABR540_09170 [Acidimicrobiales bacterium]
MAAPFRRRRILVVAPAAALAGVLGFIGLAEACVVQRGRTDASATTAEPGQTIMIGATAVGTPNSAYRLRLANKRTDCHHGGVALGGVVNSDASGAIAPVARAIPTNTTSGVRYLCWLRPTTEDFTSAFALTIV